MKTPGNVRRITLTAVVMAACHGSLAMILVEGCGHDAGVPDGSAPDSSDVSQGDAPVVGDSDVTADVITGCPYTPVVCPDADYYITINGDGLQQTLRSNETPPKGDLWGADAEYHIPLAQYFPGQGSPAHQIWASGSPDGGGAFIVISPDLGWATAYIRNDGTGFTSDWADATPATLVYTQGDPPGGFVAGNYSVSVATNPAADAATLLSVSGTFFACRICDAPPMP